MQITDITNDKLQVVALPAGSAYRNGGYELDSMYDEIEANLNSKKIEFLDLRDDFSDNPQDYFDENDRLTPEGNERLSSEIHDLLDEPKNGYQMTRDQNLSACSSPPPSIKFVAKRGINALGQNCRAGGKTGRIRAVDL